MKKNTNFKSKIAKYFIPSLILILTVGIIITIFGLKKDHVNEEIIDKYYTFLGSNDLTLCNGLIAYDSLEITKDVLNYTDKVCNSYLNLATEKVEKVKVDKNAKKNNCTYEKFNFATDNYEKDYCTIEKIAVADLKAEYNLIYNEEIGDLEDFYIDENKVCHYQNDYYYCGLAETFSYSLMARPHVYRAIKKTVEQDDTIYIYDLFLKTREEKCYNTFNTDEENAACSKKYAQKGEINYRLLKKYGTLYRHTFKLNKETGEYYWYASQPEK